MMEGGNCSEGDGRRVECINGVAGARGEADAAF